MGNLQDFVVLKGSYEHIYNHITGRELINRKGNIISIEKVQKENKDRSVELIKCQN
ncbi:MAG: hypothetical protein ACJATI_002875 [Halioglobus sp.]|jgi:hypothetical protein